MAEYIERNAIYEKISELEELARNRVVDTPSTSPAYARYVSQLNERTALKHMIFDTPAADVAPVVHGHIKNICVDEAYCEMGDCSVCGTWNPLPANFCRICGAKMGMK